MVALFYRFLPPIGRFFFSSFLFVTADPKAKRYFKRIISRYDAQYVIAFLEKPLHINEYICSNTEEANYRRWCLKKHLFLNPLNDLVLEHTCFAADVLQLPGIVTPIKEKDIPIYFGLFNQIKQEFVYARYLCYQGQPFCDEPHYADKETCLVNLYDYPQYSIRIEQEKTAFRLLYSLFDKVAFFANKYWKLGIKDRDVTFHSIWKEESGYKHKCKHAAIDAQNNESLLSIKWIYKDFNDRFGNSAHPELQKFNMLRNALEHKYVKVHSGLQYSIKEPYFDTEGIYHISDDDLQKFTIELICLVRELIIELSMAVHIEELKRRQVYDKSEIISQLTLQEYDDEWKF